MGTNVRCDGSATKSPMGRRAGCRTPCAEEASAGGGSTSAKKVGASVVDGQSSRRERTAATEGARALDVTKKSSSEPPAAVACVADESHLTSWIAAPDPAAPLVDGSDGVSARYR